MPTKQQGLEFDGVFLTKKSKVKTLGFLHEDKLLIGWTTWPPLSFVGFQQNGDSDCLQNILICRSLLLFWFAYIGKSKFRFGWWFYNGQFSASASAWRASVLVFCWKVKMSDDCWMLMRVGVQGVLLPFFHLIIPYFLFGHQLYWWGLYARNISVCSRPFNN
jgi:hypothetical protein